MNIESEFTRLQAEHRYVLRQFVLTELTLAGTFAERALTENEVTTTPDEEREQSRKHNVKNANKAYESALHAIERSDQGVETDPDVASRLQAVRSLLERLNDLMQTPSEKSVGER